LRGGIGSSWEEMSLPFMRAEESAPWSIPTSRTHQIERTPVDSAGCNRLLNAGEGDAPDDGVPLPVSTSGCRRAPETDWWATVDRCERERDFVVGRAGVKFGWADFSRLSPHDNFLILFFIFFFLFYFLFIFLFPLFPISIFNSGLNSNIVPDYLQIILEY
jgi:hypothetical protein